MEKIKSQIVDDVKHDINEARPSKPFHIFNMTCIFLDFDAAGQEDIDKTHLGTKTAAWLLIDKANPGVVKVKSSFSEMETWEEYYVLKPEVNTEVIQSTTFYSLPAEIQLPKGKITDILNFLPHIKEETNLFS
ncbi:hypothetical protein PR048_025178 [Dryococelus australis]|uniref:Uncharacterized protein n=1 Tax=Dryococelus australis TaxID=614101 RepID=A0ABQ9GQM4_9NEOP|nr:hypothetical protein PR048_025178 [Dryococelus australis]